MSNSQTEKLSTCPEHGAKSASILGHYLGDWCYIEPKLSQLLGVSFELVAALVRGGYSFQ